MAITVTICGGGNASHVMMGQIGSIAGITTQVLDIQNASKLKEALKKNDNCVTVRNVFTNTEQTTNDDIISKTTTKKKQKTNTISKTTIGKVDLVSSCPKDVIPGSDLILLPLPVFAHRPYLEAIAPHVHNGSTVGVLPGQGGSQWLAKTIFGSKFKDVTFFGGDKLPYNARIDQYGQSVNLVGLKPKVGIATIPPNEAERVSKLCTEAFEGFWSGVPLLGSILEVSLMPVNQCLHPCRMYDLFSEWDGKKIWKDNPLFYDDMTDNATSMMTKVDDEIQNVAECLRTQHDLNVNIPRVHPMLVSWYDEDMIDDASTLTSYFRTNRGYRGIGTPMAKVVDENNGNGNGGGGWIPDFTTRYFTEDVPYGLCVTRGVASMIGVETPTIDVLIEWAQTNMGKEYLVDGQFVGKDVRDTFSPQAFGFNKPTDLF